LIPCLHEGEAPCRDQGRTWQALKCIQMEQSAAALPIEHTGEGFHPICQTAAHLQQPCWAFPIQRQHPPLLVGTKEAAAIASLLACQKTTRQHANQRENELWPANGEQYRSGSAIDRQEVCGRPLLPASVGVLFAPLGWKNQAIEPPLKISPWLALFPQLEQTAIETPLCAHLHPQLQPAPDPRTMPPQLDGLSSSASLPIVPCMHHAERKSLQLM